MCEDIIVCLGYCFADLKDTGIQTVRLEVVHTEL